MMILKTMTTTNGYDNNASKNNNDDVNDDDDDDDCNDEVEYNDIDIDGAEYNVIGLLFLLLIMTTT